MNEIEAHINELFEDVPESRRKTEIIQEINQNFTEKVSDLVTNGWTKEQAIKKAFDDFGDASDLKEELSGCDEVVKSKKAGLLLAFSIWGGILITALMLFINFYYSPKVIWFVYPAFAVFWWPMSMFFHWYHVKNKKPIGLSFSICSSALLTGLLLFMNFYYTPQYIWFIYPLFAIIWWPMAMLFHRLSQKNKKADDIDD